MIDSLQISVFEVDYQGYSQPAYCYRSDHGVIGGTAIGTQKFGCLPARWRGQVCQCQPARLLPLHVIHPYIAYFTCPLDTLQSPHCLTFHLQKHISASYDFLTHPFWKCLLSTQNRFQRVEALIFVFASFIDFSLIRRCYMAEVMLWFPLLPAT